MAESRDITAEHARVAAQIEADVGVEHIANVYADALLRTTEQAKTTEAVLGEFDAVMSDIINRYPKLEAIFVSGLVTGNEKTAVLDRILAGRISPTLMNFLKVVAQHGRLDCLRAIHQQAHALWDKLQNRIPVTLKTATPVDPATVDQIIQNLRTKLGCEPMLDQQVDPNLIGGAVLQVGDMIYDGSIARQLQKLRQQMTDRSAHEIQSRRDRFRYPAGN